MNVDEATEFLREKCQYTDICPQSNYGGRWECLYDKQACPTYYSNCQVELSMWDEYSVLEKKIFLVSDTLEVEEDESS